MVKNIASLTYARLLEGFAIFFSVFEVTRRVALRAKAASHRILDARGDGVENVTRQSTGAIKSNFPRIIHCGTLITGGVGKPMYDPKLTLKISIRL